jgi:hypothetical protein
MLEVSIYSAIAAIGGVLGMVVGRVFAIEGGRRLPSIFAAAYVGAGAGLMASVLIGPILTLVAQYLNAGSSTWFDALDVASTALFWGTLAGAAGGLASGIVIALLPSSWFPNSPGSTGRP